MGSEFCVFILSHGRPDRVHTVNSLAAAGYTGRIVLVLDNEDSTAERYRENYPDLEIEVFDKAKVHERTDTLDNFPQRNTVLFARNACWDIARKLGVSSFLQLDDDYRGFYLRHGGQRSPVKIRSTMNDIFAAFVEVLKNTRALTLAFSQGGDWIGGSAERGGNHLMRKAMNSFFCLTDREFSFRGRLNDDVSTYLALGARGELFFTFTQVMLTQEATQSAEGGLTEMYRQFGVYTKAFYSVMAAPSCCRIGTMPDSRGVPGRIHHTINWHKAVPKIVREIPS